MKIDLPEIKERVLKKFFPLASPGLVNKDANSLRVVTLNVHFGKQHEEVSRLLKEHPNLSQADIILFQEMEEHETERVSRAVKIARALKFHYAYVPARRLLRKKGTHGLAIFSRLPLQKVETVKLPYFQLPLRRRPRITLKAEVEHGGKVYSIYNVHLDATLNHKERLAQLDAVIKHIESQEHHNPIILGGDFNTIPMFLIGRAIPVFYSNQKKKLGQYLNKKGFETKCQAAGHTLKAGLMRFQLDGIYTKRVPIARCAVEREVEVSDHYPLWADISVV